MPHSGIKTSDQVKMTYLRVFNRKANKLPYAVFKFADDCKEIIVDDNEEFYKQQLAYNDLLGKLPNNAPRFFCYDFGYLNKDGTKTSSVILLSWFPKDTPTRMKFISGSSFLSLAATLSVNKSKYMQGEEISDLNEAAVCADKDWTILPEAQRDPLSQEKINIFE